MSKRIAARAIAPDRFGCSLLDEAPWLLSVVARRSGLPLCARRSARPTKGEVQTCAARRLFAFGSFLPSFHPAACAWPVPALLRGWPNGRFHSILSVRSRRRARFARNRPRTKTRVGASTRRMKLSFASLPGASRPPGCAACEKRAGSTGEGRGALRPFPSRSLCFAPPLPRIPRLRPALSLIPFKKRLNHSIVTSHR